MSEADLTATTPEFTSVVRGICKRVQIIVSLGFADSRHSLPARGIYTTYSNWGALFKKCTFIQPCMAFYIFCLLSWVFSAQAPTSLAVLFLSMKHIWQRGTSAAVVKVKNCAC